MKETTDQHISKAVPRSITNQLDELLVLCSLCDLTVRRKHFAWHLEKCPNRDVECPASGKFKKISNYLR